MTSRRDESKWTSEPTERRAWSRVAMVSGCWLLAATVLLLLDRWCVTREGLQSYHGISADMLRRKARSSRTLLDHDMLTLGAMALVRNAPRLEARQKLSRARRRASSCAVRNARQNMDGLKAYCRLSSDKYSWLGLVHTYCSQHVEGGRRSTGGGVLCKCCSAPRLSIKTIN